MKSPGSVVEPHNIDDTHQRILVGIRVLIIPNLKSWDSPTLFILMHFHIASTVWEEHLNNVVSDEHVKHMITLN